MADKDLLVSRIFLRSALPLVKTLAEENPTLKMLFPKSAVIQFAAKNADVGAYILFEEGEINVKQGLAEKADLTITFKNVAEMNAFFAGKMKIPSFKGIKNIHLLFRILPLLLGLKILMPDAMPKRPRRRR
jgi:hypothetical protein